MVIMEVRLMEVRLVEVRLMEVRLLVYYKITYQMCVCHLIQVYQENPYK